MTRNSMRIGLSMTCLLGIGLALGATGCTGSSGDLDPARAQRGMVYYLDGAGGGGVVANWAGGVRDGLLDAGYDGAGETFRWQTGLGVVIDQTVSNSYKRGKARKLAKQMVAFRQEYPESPITVIGLSAGTAIAVFALEELPADVMVENVILLSGSLSATHDLGTALRHVNGRMYVSTSHRDAVLGGLLPLTGTADRGSGTSRTIGVEGPTIPRGASSETRRLYAARLHVVPWKSEFARYGNSGGHTGSVSRAFVARYVAPLVKTASATEFALARSDEPGTAPNPAYNRWAGFAPGSYVVVDGTKTIAGKTSPVRVKTTLVSNTPSRVVLRREEISPEGERLPGAFVQTLYESATVAPAENPITHPDAQVRDLPGIRFRAGTREIVCPGKSISAPAEFAAWGSNPKATVYLSPEVPGGIVSMDIQTTVHSKPVEVSGKAVLYHAIPKE